MSNETYGRAMILTKETTLPAVGCWLSVWACSRTSTVSQKTMHADETRCRHHHHQQSMFWHAKASLAVDIKSNGVSGPTR